MYQQEMHRRGIMRSPAERDYVLLVSSKLKANVDAATKQAPN